eukprot:CAMPEP_0202692384 /NCGR_PEP_ID=MMETSP1385-20130828/6779_1 /ASSEMBLY_ACC=CAM_ASM_000861 /TAXON_ID=933848 /ORGANISM="Elphidium margaritaceum" /LENGTH=48 /DNA_ID= /DNA_START= /DNA_END= /DNA_ORIENTATION=
MAFILAHTKDDIFEAQSNELDNDAEQDEDGYEFSQRHADKIRKRFRHK